MRRSGPRQRRRRLARLRRLGVPDHPLRQHQRAGAHGGRADGGRHPQRGVTLGDGTPIAYIKRWRVRAETAMKIDGKHYRSVWVGDDGWSVHILDQTKLPHAVEILRLTTPEDVGHAIKSMQTRGAPLIGACGAYGMCLALRADPSDASLARAYGMLIKTRPTAVNLRWALDAVRGAVAPLPPPARAAAAYAKAQAICDEDVAICASIGRNGLALFRDIAARRPGKTLNVLTHCNAGWLATVDWGTALAPIFMAHDAGMDVHVWVDETRPRNQGA